MSTHTLKLDEYEEVWLTSDTHFGHANIIKYCNRPFKDTNEMDESIIKTWNSQVDPHDLVIHLGDVAFAPSDRIKYIMDRLPGHKLLVLGNHDKRENLEYFFDKGIYDYLEVIRGKQKLVLFHYPIDSWNGKYHHFVHLHGHTHGTYDNRGLLRFDMGVDCNDMKLVNLDAFCRMSKEQFFDKEAEVRVRDEKFRRLYKIASEDKTNIISEE